MSKQAKWCGLPQTESQQGKTFNKMYRLHRCTCNEGRKNRMIRKFVNEQKKQDP